MIRCARWRSASSKSIQASEDIGPPWLIQWTTGVPSDRLSVAAYDTKAHSARFEEVGLDAGQQVETLFPDGVAR